jgi:predicted AlkP superfamily pyrophosphatase or phosphodiesterase
MDGGLKMPGKVYYDAVYTSPFGNEVLLGFVKKALDAEGLGTRNVPDLLCVSFSCNDSVGHVWGPDSQEVLDTTLRTDALLKDLLDTLDAKVGKGKYIVALSSDHGVCPLPEVAAMEGKDARRSIPVDLRKAADEFLEKTFPRQAASRPIKVLLNDAFYLNADWVKTQGVAPGKIEQALADWLKARPGVQTAYTRSQLAKGLPENDELGQLAMRSFHPERSGDVLMIPKPYWITSWTRLTGTTHGSPHPYDRHVPLLVYGPGLVPGVRMDRVTPQANVPILAKALGIAPPAKCNCPLPEKVFK